MMVHVMAHTRGQVVVFNSFKINRSAKNISVSAMGCTIA